MKHARRAQVLIRKFILKIVGISVEIVNAKPSRGEALNQSLEHVKRDFSPEQLVFHEIQRLVTCSAPLVVA
jgi:hypothetical protein